MGFLKAKLVGYGHVGPASRNPGLKWWMDPHCMINQALTIPIRRERYVMKKAERAQSPSPVRGRSRTCRGTRPDPQEYVYTPGTFTYQEILAEIKNIIHNLATIDGQDTRDMQAWIKYIVRLRKQMRNSQALLVSAQLDEPLAGRKSD